MENREVHLLPQSELALFDELREIVEATPHHCLGNDEVGEPIVPHCHIVTSALANVYDNLRVVVGNVNGGWGHSWLETEGGLIIDAQPWGVVNGPILVYGSPYGHTPFAAAYSEEQKVLPRLEVGVGNAPFDGLVERLTEVFTQMREVIQRGR